MTQIHLRRASLADRDVIRACIADAYAKAIRDLSDLPDVTSGIDEDIRTQDVFVAEENDAALGVIVFAVKSDAVMVHNLAVRAAAQGRGIARKLLGLAESAAHRAGLSCLRLRTHVQMIDTRAMYRHLGWQEVETKGNTVLMEKSVR